MMLAIPHRLPAALALCGALASAPAQDLLVRAKTIVVATDTVSTDGALLVREGRVAWVGRDIPAETRGRALLVDYGDATIVPGFVLPPTTLGRDRDLAEAALPFTPDLRAVEAFDPWQEELLRLPRTGITSLLLAPSPRNVAGGIAALVKPGKDAGRVAEPDLQLVLSLARAARTPDRAPTSLMGAVDLLRTAFTAAKTGVEGGPDVAVLRGALQGSRRVVVHADTFVELVAALELAREFAFEPLLVGAGDAEKVLPRLVEQKAAIALDTLKPEMRLAQLELPARLAAAGVPFCFGGSAEHVRLSAVLAVRHGLDRNVALQALTRTPAVLLGQADAVGSLRQGTSADFAVFSGHPLDLDSTLLATWIDGVRVHGEAPKPTTTPAAVDATAALPAAAGDR